MTVSHVLDTAITLDPRVLVLLSLILPAAVALATKRLASGTVKALTLLALSILTGIVAGWVENGATFRPGDVAWTALVLFLVGVLAHFGLLKPLGVTGTDGVIARNTPNVGVGGTTPPA